MRKLIVATVMPVAAAHDAMVPAPSCMRITAQVVQRAGTRPATLTRSVQVAPAFDPDSFDRHGIAVDLRTNFLLRIKGSRVIRA